MLRQNPRLLAAVGTVPAGKIVATAIREAAAVLIPAREESADALVRIALAAAKKELSGLSVQQ